MGLTGAPALTANTVSHRFGDRTVLSSVSLDAFPGEATAIVGPNGAGKTTLLSILSGSLKQSEGKVDLAEGGIGWVPQQAALYSKLSVTENLKLFAELEGISDVSNRTQEMLEQTELVERSNELVGNLSGGNRQRVNVAVGVIGRPSVLLLDEPTTALDPRQRERLWQYVDRLKASGTSVIYSTHYLQEVESSADHVLVLAEGQQLFYGNPKELISQFGDQQSGFERAFVSFLKEHGH